MDRSVEQAQTKLFTIYSSIDNWWHRGQLYGDVSVMWHVGERQEPPIPYSQAIEGYEPGASMIYYTEDYIDGLFTEEEAALLGKYLSEHHDTEIELEEVHLPVSDNRTGMWCLPIGSTQGMYQLYEEGGYDLPFRVGGWYDISNSREWTESEKDHEELKFFPDAVMFVEFVLREGGISIQNERLIQMVQAVEDMGWSIEIHSTDPVPKMGENMLGTDDLSEEHTEAEDDIIL